MKLSILSVLFSLAAANLIGCVTSAPDLTPQPDKDLAAAVDRGDLTAVGAALDRGAQIDRRRGDMTNLDWAIYNGNRPLVKLLVERGADVNAPNTNFSEYVVSPLGFAAMRRDRQSANLLIAKGANVQDAIDCLERVVTHNAPYATAANPANLQSFNEANSGIKMLEALQKAPEPVAAPVAQAAPVPRPVAPSLPTITPSYSQAAAENDYAVVIGIENYGDLPTATYAERDAAAMKNFIRAMGVPERNVAYLTGARATKSGFEKTIEDWLPNNVNEKSRVFFYYSGHGAPDPKSGGAYLLPSDGDPQYLARTGYPLKQLYFQLGQLRAKSVFVALDSCFSGAGGRSVLAKGTRPLVGKIDVAVQPEGKVSVLSAAAGDQTSGSTDEAGYGLFTYNLLQGLNGAAKDADGRVTLKSLYGYLKPRVQDEARRGNRDQTPQLQSAGGDDFVLRAK